MTLQNLIDAHFLFVSQNFFFINYQFHLKNFMKDSFKKFQYFFFFLKMRKTDRHRKSCIATAETLEGLTCFIFKEILFLSN